MVLAGASERRTSLVSGLIRRIDHAKVGLADDIAPRAPSPAALRLILCTVTPLRTPSVILNCQNVRFGH